MSSARSASGLRHPLAERAYYFSSSNRLLRIGYFRQSL